MAPALFFPVKPATRTRSRHGDCFRHGAFFAIRALAAFAFVSAPLATPLPAQDVIICEPVTYTGLDDGQSLPPLTLARSPLPEYPENMRGFGGYGYAIALSPPPEGEAPKGALTSGSPGKAKKGKAPGSSVSERATSAGGISRNAPMQGFVSTRGSGNANAKNPVTSVSAGHYTNRNFQRECAKVMDNWKWEPQFPDEDDTRRAWAAIIFNPVAASASSATAKPRLLSVTPVIFPPGTEVPTVFLERMATARVTVGASGEIKNVRMLITSKTSEFVRRHKDAIEQVVHKWKFAPARNNGAAIEAAAVVPVLLLPALPVPAPAPARIPSLKPLMQVHTVYPKAMESVGGSCAVTLEFTLDDKGRPKNPIVVFSPDQHFDKPALDAIRKYVFEIPKNAKRDSRGNKYAQLGDARWQYEVNFAPPRMITRKVRETWTTPCYSCCGMIRLRRTLGPPIDKVVALPGTKIRGQNITRPVLAPASVKTVAPVYPYEMLRKNVTGSATVRMPCDTDRSDGCPEIIKKSDKNFGYALAAAVRYYTIEPGKWAGKPVSSMLTAKFDFNPLNPELRLSEKTRRLLAEEKQNPGKIIPEGKLDSPLEFQEGPRPSSLHVNDELKGSTIIEFLVDETGCVHLPRIMQTETPEVAHVLMQQISLRAYAPPLQNGNPVVARAREILNFP